MLPPLPASPSLRRVREMSAACPPQVRLLAARRVARRSLLQEAGRSSCRDSSETRPCHVHGRRAVPQEVGRHLHHARRRGRDAG